MEKVPYIIHESIVARMERTIKRMWILCILLIIFLIGSNIAWIIHEAHSTGIVAEQQGETMMNDLHDAG